MLIDLQHQLQSYLLADDEQIFSQLKSPVNGDLADRLAIYANGYFWRLIEALQKAYDPLYVYLGQDQFLDMAEIYIEDYPSRYYSIADFTQHLPEFLTEYWVKEPYLSEFSVLIRALNQSAAASHEDCLLPKQLAAISTQDWPKLRFRFHSSVQCLNQQWNSFDVWRNIIQKKSLLSWQFKPRACIVWRKQLQSYANTLTQTQALIFQSIQQGNCFSQICETILQSQLIPHSDVANEVGNCIMRWVHDECFAEVYIL